MRGKRAFLASGRRSGAGRRWCLLALFCAPWGLGCRVVETPPPASRDRAPDVGTEPARQPETQHLKEPEPTPPTPPQAGHPGRGLGGTTYPFGAVFSPLTRSVRDELEAIAAKNPALHSDRFLKVGDSISKSPKFLQCFSAGRTRWGEHVDLAPVVDQYKNRDFDSFSRESLSAEDGWSAWQSLHGREPPLEQELSEVMGRFALVMFGTNDIETSRVSTFFRRLLSVVRVLSERGVVSILSTIPERHDKPGSGAKVPIFNAAIRAVAQARRLPLIDYHQALGRLPGDGLASDGIHPNAYRQGGLVRACDLDAQGLEHGFNVRNLLSLQALERVAGALADTTPSEPEPAPLPGAGSWEQPFEIGVPSVSSPAPTTRVTAVPPCLARWEKQPQAAVTTYRVKLERGQALEWLAMDASSGAPLSYWVASPTDQSGCVEAGRGFARLPLGSGEHWVRVVGSGVPQVLAVVASRP